MAMFYAMVQAFNHLVWPEEEEELGEFGRRQQHLILGRRPDGSIMTVRMQGALADALIWIGAEDMPSDIKDVRSGKKQWWQLLAEAPKATVNRLVQGIRPDIKGTAEVISGRQAFPDITKPRPIRDKAEHVARMFSLDPIYRRIRERPSRERGLFDKLLADMGRTVTSTTDPGEAAYYDARTLVFDYLEKNNIERPMADPTNRSNALYYYRKALRVGDGPAAWRYLREYHRLGGSLKGMKASIQRAHPLAALPKRHRLRFMAQAKPEDRERIRKALRWYARTYRKAA